MKQSAKVRGIAHGQLEAQLRRCHVGCHESPVQRQLHFGIRPVRDERVAKQCRDSHPQRQCDVYASQIFSAGLLKRHDPTYAQRPANRQMAAIGSAGTQEPRV